MSKTTIKYYTSDNDIACPICGCIEKARRTFNHRRSGPKTYFFCMSCIRQQRKTAGDRYRGTEKGLAARSKYTQSPKGRTTRRLMRFRNGDSGERYADRILASINLDDYQ